MRESSTILIVDDDPYGRDALGMLLDSNGYDLIYAQDGPEGIQRAHESLPDLILLDVMMPGMDGFTVCRHLRDDSVLAEVPVLMVTALDDRGSRIQGIQAGADDFISKPIDAVELLARVQGITRLNRYRHLLNQRHQFEWVLDQTDDGYVVLDEQDVVCFANPKARRYFEPAGVDGSLDGANFVEVLRARYQHEPVVAWAAWAQRPFCHHEPLYLIQPQQETSPAIWLQVSILDQLGGGTGQRLVRVQDVSAQKINQQAMWAFQSTIRHKLNTPLHAITSCLDLLSAHELAEMDKEEYREILSWTREAMQRLESSVASVLRHAEAPELGPGNECYPLARLAEDVKRVAAEMAIDQWELVVDDEVAAAPESGMDAAPLRGELAISEAALVCILTELFDNAKKFHPLGNPSIRLRVQRLLGDDGSPRARIRVADDGISLSPVQLEKIWTPYYQSERSFTGEVPGMGLGLSLVQSLLWHVGGSCTSANRADGPGLEVEITLPFN